MADNEYVRDENSGAVVTPKSEFEKWKEKKKQQNLLNILLEHVQYMKQQNEIMNSKLDSILQRLDRLENRND